MSTSDAAVPVTPRLPDGSKAMLVIASGEVPLVAGQSSRLKGREATGVLHLPDEPPALPEPDEPPAPPEPDEPPAPPEPDEPPAPPAPEPSKSSG
ncbi:hypothetical protein [Sorangium sp. So ce1389]|uniref:hypothetical protein n=1 Tax=Sorangium sp. So ce1389 TaxID=3133336 RepID=UPI003F62B767